MFREQGGELLAGTRAGRVADAMDHVSCRREDLRQVTPRVPRVGGIVPQRRDVVGRGGWGRAAGACMIDLSGDGLEVVQVQAEEGVVVLELPGQQTDLSE